MGRLNYILTAKPNIDDRHAKVPEGAKPRGEIEFRHLTFTYPTTLCRAGSNRFFKSNCFRQHPVFRDLNLKVSAGSTPALLGPTSIGTPPLSAFISPLSAARDACLWPY